MLTTTRRAHQENGSEEHVPFTQTQDEDLAICGSLSKLYMYETPGLSHQLSVQWQFPRLSSLTFDFDEC